MTETNRVEAFSDGVLAIAITLLVLDLKVPPRGAEPLAPALRAQWPSYAAYVTSFLVIGVIWVNHHTLFRVIARVDRFLLFANLLLLMIVSAFPFTTALAAEYLTHPGHDGAVALAVYAVNSLLMGVAFSAVWTWAVLHPALLDPRVDVVRARRELRRLRFNVGAVAYLVLVGVAFVSPVLCLLGQFAMALYYVVDRLPSPGEAPASAGTTG